jgi:hypothetical protein
MKGEYVAFIDSDDFVELNFIEMLHNEMIRSNVDVCKSGGFIYNDTNLVKEIISYSYELFKGDDLARRFLPRIIGSSPTENDSIIQAVWGCMFKSHVIKNNNVLFPDQKVLISEDIPFWIELVRFISSSCIINYVGYYYRQNIYSLSKSYNPNRYTQSRYFFITIKYTLIKYGYNVDVVNRLRRYYFIMVRTCISQLKRNSSLGLIDILKLIDEICSDNVLVDEIRAYPVNKLPFKQKSFIYLIKYRAAIILYLFI